MKKCENCGWLTDNPADVFCEKCGERLTEISGTEEKKRGKNGVIPIIVGCAAVVVVIITGTVIGIGILKEKNQEQTVQTAEVEIEESSEDGQTLPEGQKAEEETDETGKTQEDADGAAPEEIQDFQMSELGETGASESGDQEADMGAQASAEDQDAAVSDNSEAAGQEEIQTTENVGQEQKYETCFVVNCRESITLRKSPSTKAEEYCQIPLGAAVSYVGTAGNGFYQVIYNGQSGYALASYLSFDSGENPEEQDVTYMEVVNCRESITLRKTPSTKGEEFCQIPLGALVEYKGTAENGFYMVVYNGYTGYALASYLTER